MAVNLAVRAAAEGLPQPKAILIAQPGRHELLPLENLAKLPAKDQPIVAVCGIGHRGAMTMMALQMLGYTNVKHLSAGIHGWVAAKATVEKGS